MFRWETRKPEFFFSTAAGENFENFGRPDFFHSENKIRNPKKFNS